MRYLARKYNQLNGETEKDRVAIDRAEGFSSDLRSGFLKIVFSGNYEADKKAYFENLQTTLKPLEDYLTANHGQPVTNCPTSILLFANVLTRSNSWSLDAWTRPPTWSVTWQHTTTCLASPITKNLINSRSTPFIRPTETGGSPKASCKLI